MNYGLGNFLWYHNHQPETGVLRLRIEDGDVVRDNWVPARIQTLGRAAPPPRRGPHPGRRRLAWASRLHRPRVEAFTSRRVSSLGPA